MRQGNILEGILAGFQAYKNTRDWQAQQKSTQLEQERGALANRMLEQSYEDTTNPMGKFERERPVREAAFGEEIQQRKAIGEADISEAESTFERRWALKEKELRRAGATERDIFTEKAKEMKRIGVYGEGVYPAERFDRAEPSAQSGTAEQVKRMDAEKIVDAALERSGLMVSSVEREKLIQLYQSGNGQMAGAIIDSEIFINDKDGNTREEFSFLETLPEDFNVTIDTGKGMQKYPWKEYYLRLFMSGADKASKESFINLVRQQARASGAIPQKQTFAKGVKRNLDVVIPPPARPMIYKGATKTPYTGQKK